MKIKKKCNETKQYYNWRADIRLCSVPDKSLLLFENWPCFYDRVAFLQSKFESWNNVSKVVSCGLPCWPLCQKRSVLGSTKYPNFSENLQYWRYFDPCRPYPYRPYCVYSKWQHLLDHVQSPYINICCFLARLVARSAHFTRHVMRVGTFWRLRDTSLANKSFSLELFEKFSVEIKLTMYGAPLKAKKFLLAFRISSQMVAKVTK